MYIFMHHKCTEYYIFQLSGPEVVMLKDILLQVVDEVCDIICQIKTGDLMNFVSSDYERLQKLLTVRLVFLSALKNIELCFII